MKRKTMFVAFAMCMALAACATTNAQDAPKAADVTPQETLLKAFAQTGAATYAQKAKVNPLLPDAYVAFDAEGKATGVGVIQKTRLYQNVTLIMALQLKDKTYVVAHASVPDIAAVKDATKQKKLADAIVSCHGRVVKTLVEDPAGTKAAPSQVDGVTGATHTQKTNAKHLEDTVKALVALLDNPPADWEKKDLVVAEKMP